LLLIILLSLFVQPGWFSRITVGKSGSFNGKLDFWSSSSRLLTGQRVVTGVTVELNRTRSVKISILGCQMLIVIGKISSCDSVIV